MASVPVPVTNVGSGYNIITQVLPSSTASTTAEQNSTQTHSPLSKFLKGEPKALGTVQILNGLWMIVMSIFPFLDYLYLLWGPLIQILAGSLNVSASRKMNPCAVKAALTLNILSAITTGISIIFICLSFERVFWSGYFSIRWDFPEVILLVFSLLQFAISISLSVFACKATCLTEPVMNIINVVPNPEVYVPVENSSSAHPFAISISLSVFACKATCLKEPVMNIINVVPNPEVYVPVENSSSAHPGISTLNTAAMNQTPAGSAPTNRKIKDQLEDRNYF